MSVQRSTSRSVYSEIPDKPNESTVVIAVSVKKKAAYKTLILFSCVADFEVVSAFPYVQYIVCCTKQSEAAPKDPETAPDSVTWPDDIRSIVTLGRRRQGDKMKVKDLTGPTELHRDLHHTQADEGCPTFQGFSVIRRFVKMWQPKRPKNIWFRPTIQRLLNVTTRSESVIDDDEFANRTGMWVQDGQLHVIFCEFHTLKPAEAKHDTGTLTA